MHAPLIHVMHSQEHAFMQQEFAHKQTLAQSHLVITKQDASTNQNLVMIIFHAPKIHVLQTVDVLTLLVMHSVTITIHALLTSVLQELDALILQLSVTITTTAPLISVFQELANTSLLVMTIIHALTTNATKTNAHTNKRLAMTTTNAPLIAATKALEVV
jgi:hypothetical protein